MKMNIKDIVEQVQETPSPRCWESIASQLPAAGTAIGGGSAATAAKGAFSAGKLAAIIGSTAAVVAVVTGTTIAILKHEPTTENHLTSDNQTQISVSDSIPTYQSDIYLVETETEPQNTILNPIPADKSSDKEKNVVLNTSNSIDATEPDATSINPVSTTPTTPINPDGHLTSTSSPATTQNTQTQNVITKNDSQASLTNKPQEDNPNNVTSSNNLETDINPEDYGYSQPVIFEIPNFFSPNGDGVNDQFVIKGIEQCDKRILIVKNHKGETVFQSNRYDNNWDGGNLPDGTYLYQFMYSINNINEVRKGYILIQRQR